MNNLRIKALRQDLRHAKRSLARAEQAGYDLEQFKERIAYFEHELLKAGADLEKCITRRELSTMYVDTLIEIEGMEYMYALEHIAGLPDKDLENESNAFYEGTGTSYTITT